MEINTRLDDASEMLAAWTPGGVPRCSHNMSPKNKDKDNEEEDEEKKEDAWRGVSVLAQHVTQEPSS